MSVPSEVTEVVFKRLPPPKESIQPDTTKANPTFEVKTNKLDSLKDGQILIKSLIFSNDPTQRTWLRKPGDNRRAYIAPVYEGETMEALGIGEVIDSKSDKFKQGDVVNARIKWADYSIINESSVFNKIDNTQGLPLEYYLSVLGMTSLTAFFGLIEAGQLKKYLNKRDSDLIIAVSAASGAVGSIVVQIAKHLLGAKKVIGLAGSDAKCKWVEEIGADLCVNYKSENYQKKIDEFLDNDWVDVYFDNVGGEILSYFLSKMKEFGRIAACGSIAGYNNPDKALVSNWFNVVSSTLTIEGFLVMQYKDKIPEATKILSDAIKSGKIQTEKAYHVEELKGNDEREKFTEIPKIWNLLFDGDKPNGKLLIKVK
ncbi:unnamed protein product [Candida verbasci]|uniref:Enoyl reductase (ER) domain-containing protein n=1 Tax=Candida verbasci TaxID=1227364 RepID=A0A9W4XIF5_9ASCO|nr:unnamed protein product [Candida verbasci]